MLSANEIHIRSDQSCFCYSFVMVQCGSMCETCESGDLVYCTKCKNDVPIGIFERDLKKGVCLEEKYCAVGITELNNIRYWFEDIVFKF